MIEVKNLSKRFGEKVAVNNISFTVQKGEVLGFLGPNGAGKSTTMRMVTGYLPSSEGKISIGGLDIEDEEIEAKSKIGYLPENAPLYSDMSVQDFLRFCAEMRRVPSDKLSGAIDKALETCFLQPVRHQSVDTLSKGYRHRTCLAQAIIHDPEVLILDEPTDGLDPNQKHEVRGLIKRMGEEKAIIFSTHILEEVEAACSRAIIVDQGSIVADGTPNQLKSKAENADSVIVTFAGEELSGLRQELEKLSTVSGVEVIDSGKSRLHARVRPTKAAKREGLSAAIFDLAVAKSIKIEELRRDEGRLDDVFRQITASDSEVAAA